MSQKFTFHIPNLFPRDSQQPESESESQYSQLPTTSNQDQDAVVDRDEQRLAVERQPRDRHGMPHTHFGVDSTLSWKRKSNIYKTFIWLAFGTLGAAVLLPLWVEWFTNRQVSKNGHIFQGKHNPPTWTRALSFDPREYYHHERGRWRDRERERDGAFSLSSLLSHLPPSPPTSDWLSTPSYLILPQ